MKVDFSKIKFDTYGNVEQPVLILKTLSNDIICPLGNYFNFKPNLKFNSVSEISFDIPAQKEGIDTPFYEQITGLKLVQVDPYGLFILSNPETNGDGIKEIKSCTGYSLENELNDVKMVLEQGTYNFYNPVSPDNTIIGIVHDLAPDWNIGTISEKLIGRYRTFENIDSPTLTFLLEEVQKSFNCIFVFDTYTRTINVIEASETPLVKSVFMSYDNLIKEVNVKEISDDIVTVINVYGADPVTIRSVNPTGGNKIYNLDYFIENGSIPVDIANKWKQWKATFTGYQNNYGNIVALRNADTGRLITEKAVLTDLQNELTSLDNVRAVIIQGIAQNLKSQSDLDEINSQIRTQNNKISAKQTEINNIQTEIDSYTNQLKSINDILRFTNFFTNDEMAVLRRYFIEDSYTDATFCLSETNSSNVADSFEKLTNTSISFSHSTIKEISMPLELNRRMFNISSGNFNILNDSKNVNSICISAVLEVKKNTNEFTMSCYLGDGTFFDNSTFPSATITLVGTLSNLVSSSTSLSFTATSGSLYLTRNITEYQQISIEQELFDKVTEISNTMSYPSYEFEIKSGNPLFLKEFEPFKNELALGSCIYLKLKDNQVIKPLLSEIHMNYEKPNDFSMVFANRYNYKDNTASFESQIDKANSTSRNVDFNKYNYGSYTNSSTKSKLEQLYYGALNASKNAVLGGINQSVSFDGSGLHLRKWNDDETAFLPEQIWQTENMIAFTDDGWNTAKMAMGKFTDKNLGTCWGVVAPNIVGTLIAGKNLNIENVSPTGKNVQFKVDSTGVFLNNTQMLMQKDGAGKLMLDPQYGMAVGTSNMYTVDDNHNITFDKDKANFYADLDGNVYMKGTIYATDGVFKGIVQASAYQDLSGRNMMTPNYKFQADYLELKGLRIKNNTSQTTFEVDSNGNVFMSGNINMKGGTISWSNINESDSASWKKATDAYSEALDAQSSAMTAEKLAKDIADGKYNGTTFIGAKTIYSPTILSDEFIIKPRTGTDLAGGYSIYGNFDNQLYHMMKISYDGANTPVVIFDSPDKAMAYWEFYKTNFYGEVDFSQANVKGVTAVFA